MAGLVVAGCVALAAAACGRPPPVLVSQATIPDEQAFAFADIATTADGAGAVWDRFGLSAEPPVVDFDQDVLLFLGFGESGSCPARLGGISIRQAQVEVHLDEGGRGGCTADYQPRTFVVQIARASLPGDGFVLTLQRRRFVLSTVPVDRPPSGPAIVAALTADRPDLRLRADPATAEAGGTVRFVLDNRSPMDVTVGPFALERWAAQRWLPAPRQPRYEPHPAITPTTAQAPIRSGGVRVATVDTRTLTPGWYRLIGEAERDNGDELPPVHRPFQVVDTATATATAAAEQP